MHFKNNIDNLMSEYQLTDEEFFVQYFNARHTYESHRHRLGKFNRKIEEQLKKINRFCFSNNPTYFYSSIIKKKPLP